MELSLTDEQNMIRAMVRDFAKTKLNLRLLKGMKKSVLIVPCSIKWESLG